jgi:hypothetical protein
MHVQIEELKRRAEQGSQQLQGEVQELELEAILRAKFPADTIEPVRKGETDLSWKSDYRTYTRPVLPYARGPSPHGL